MKAKDRAQAVSQGRESWRTRKLGSLLDTGLYEHVFWISGFLDLFLEVVLNITHNTTS